MKVLVVGAGVFGVTAALELRARGHEVELFDRGPLPGPSADASSADSSRAVRMDYGDDAFYVDLARASLDAWRGAWGRALGPVFEQVGFLFASAARLEDAPASFEASSFRQLAGRGARVERLRAADIAERFAFFSPEAWVDGYWSRDAGYVDAAAATRALQLRAIEAGCRVRGERVVRELRERDAPGGRVELRDAAGGLARGDVALLAAGAWAPQLVPALEGVLSASAQTLLYLRPERPEDFLGEVYPTWAWDIARAGWYGFPLCAAGRVKIAHHGPGRSARLDAERRGEGVPDPALEGAARAFLAHALPALASAELDEQRVCYYCDSVDGDFWIDRVPGSAATFVATGGSGHGFKFAPILGDLIANRVEGRQDARLARFAWRDAERAREGARSPDPFH